MDTSKICVSEGMDGNERVIVVTLHGVPLVMKIQRPDRYEKALHDAQSTAALVAHGNMFWCDGVRHLIRASNYYCAPLPHHTEHDWSLEHLKEVGANVGHAVLHAPSAAAHFVKEHLPHRAH